MKESLCLFAICWTAPLDDWVGRNDLVSSSTDESQDESYRSKVECPALSKAFVPVQTRSEMSPVA
jgi:hypothetical protein